MDIDPNALRVLRINVESLQLENVIIPLCADIQSFPMVHRQFERKIPITTIMNPPFGVQKRRADRRFLERAFSFSDVIYSIHLAGKEIRQFISKFARKHDWIVDHVLPLTMILEKSFPFHSQRTKKIDVEVYRFIKKEN